MTQGIIDVLEVVQVEKQQCHLLLAATGQTDGLGQPLGEQGPVGESGEEIVVGLVGHACRHGPGFADVVEDDDGTGDAPLPVVNGRGRILN